MKKKLNSREARKLLAQLEKLIPRLHELAIGPSQIATPANVTSVIAVENLNRALPDIRVRWELNRAKKSI